MTKSTKPAKQAQPAQPAKSAKTKSAKMVKKLPDRLVNNYKSIWPTIRKLREHSKGCFAANAQFWYPDKNKATPWVHMPRDEVLAENPMSDKLVMINQQVITLDSQNADWYTFKSAHNSLPFKTDQTGLTMQRFYCEMVCQSVWQARHIAKHMTTRSSSSSSLCTYMLAYQSNKQIKLEGNHHTTVDVTIGITNDSQVDVFTRVFEMNSGQGQAMIKQFQSYLSKLYKKQTNQICWLMLVGKDFPRPSKQVQAVVPKQYSKAWIHGKHVDYAGTISFSELDAVQLNAEIYTKLATTVQDSVASII